MAATPPPFPTADPDRPTLTLDGANWAEAFGLAIADHVAGLKGEDLHAYEDLEFFSRYVMAHGNPEFQGNSKFLKQIYEILQYDTDDALILGPRGSAKSTAVSVTYVMWKIGRNPLLRILIAFASMEGQGLAFARQMDTIFTQNDRYIRVFGQLKPQNPVKWTENEKIVIRREPPSGLKDPTLSIVGLGSAVPSKRADIVICDDLVTLQNAYSELLRQQVIRFALQTLFPIVVPGGRRIIVGSRWHEKDFYQYMANQWNMKFPETEHIPLADIISHLTDADLIDLEATLGGADAKLGGQ